MSWAAVRRSVLPPRDPRTTAEIDSELDEEFAFHLALLEREFMDDGLAPDAARAAAVARFGDVRRLLAQCRRIALKERTMWRRIHLAFTILLVLVVAGTTVAAARLYQQAVEARDMAVAQEMAARTQAEAAAAASKRAEAVTSFLQRMLIAADPSSERRISVLDALHEAEAKIPSTFGDQPEVAALARQAIQQARQRATRDAEHPRPVSISSTVAPPIIFDLPADRTFALRELVSKELPRAGTQAVTTLYRRDGAEYRAIAAVTSHPDGGVDGPDAELQPGDMVFVQVSDAPQQAPSPTAKKAGLVFLSGDVTRPGVYAIPPDGRLSLRRLIAAAGGSASDGEFTASILRRANGLRSLAVSLNQEKWRDMQVEEFLQDDDYVTFERTR